MVVKALCCPTRSASSSASADASWWQVELAWYHVLPGSLPKRAWDAVVLGFVVAYAIIAPLEIGARTCVCLCVLCVCGVWCLWLQGRACDFIGTMSTRLSGDSSVRAMRCA